MQGRLCVALDYQRVLTDHLALSVPVFLVVQSSFMFQPWLQVDWHPFDSGLNGLFFGIAAMAAVIGSGQGNQYGYYVGIGPAIGYQLLLGLGINLDFALSWAALSGGFATNLAGQRSFYIIPIPYTILMPQRLEIALGYRF